MRTYHFRIFSLIAIAICFAFTATAQPGPPLLKANPIGGVQMSLFQHTTDDGTDSDEPSVDGNHAGRR